MTVTFTREELDKIESAYSKWFHKMLEEIIPILMSDITHKFVSGDIQERYRDLASKYRQNHPEPTWRNIIL